MRKITNEELGRPSAGEFARMEKMPVAVVLDNVRSMQNVGAFFRTADAFAVERIALCGITATPPNREIHKTALGAELTVAWDYFAATTDCIAALRAQGYLIYVVEQVEGAVMLDEFRPRPGQKYALVFGNEVDGVAQEVVDAADGAIEIPQAGTKRFGGRRSRFVELFLASPAKTLNLPRVTGGKRRNTRRVPDSKIENI